MTIANANERERLLVELVNAQTELITALGFHQNCQAAVEALDRVSAAHDALYKHHEAGEAEAL